MVNMDTIFGPAPGFLNHVGERGLQEPTLSRPTIEREWTRVEDLLRSASRGQGRRTRLDPPPALEGDAFRRWKER